MLTDRRLVTLAQAGYLLGWKSGTLAARKHRGQFPPADIVVPSLGPHKGVSLWYWPDLAYTLVASKTG